MTPDYERPTRRSRKLSTTPYARFPGRLRAASARAEAPPLPRSKNSTTPYAPFNRFLKSTAGGQILTRWGDLGPVWGSWGLRSASALNAQDFRRLLRARCFYILQIVV